MQSRFNHSPDVREMLDELSSYGLTPRNDNFLRQMEGRLSDPHGVISPKQRMFVFGLLQYARERAFHDSKAHAPAFKLEPQKPYVNLTTPLN